MTISTTGDITDLVNTADSNVKIETLPAQTGGYTDTDFVVNKWGYKNGLSNNYFPFQSGATVLENDTSTNEKSTTLRFATKIDYMQQEGTYSTTFNFSLVANPIVTYMQDLNPTLCTTTPTTVVDKRDDEEYLIQRLADGNCWLLDNLRLDLTDAAVQSKLTSATTNATDANLASLKNNVSGSFVLNSTAPYIDAAIKDTIVNHYGSGSGKTGVYYNYCAATAGSYCNSYNTDATEDICPRGWRLPTSGTSSGEYYTLYTAYSRNMTDYMTALSVAFTGTHAGGNTINHQGVMSYHQTSSYRAANFVYTAWFDRTGRIGWEDTLNNSYGFSVRCVLNDPRTLNDITYMQDMNPSIVANTTTGTSKSLKDKRDNEEYTVAKLADGNIWLLENLRLDLTDATVQTKLTSATTNATDASLTILKTNVTTTWSDSYTDPVIHTTYKNTVQSASGSAPAGKIGIYYNFCAASAGSYCASSGSTNATEDICPEGWRMPTGANGEYHALYLAYGSNAVDFMAALGTPLSGDFLSSSPGGQGSVGYFWSSTIGNYIRMYDLYIDASSVYPQGIHGYRNYGMSVRCVAK